MEKSSEEKKVYGDILGQEKEYQLSETPDFILSTLKRDNIEFSNLKKNFEPQIKNEWLNLKNGIQQFASTLKDTANTINQNTEIKQQIRGIRITRSFNNLGESQSRIKIAMEEMIHRVTEIVNWIEKQMDHNSTAQKVVSEYDELKKKFNANKKSKQIEKKLSEKHTELITVQEKYEEYRVHFYHYFALYWLNALFYYHLKCLEESNKTFIKFKADCKEIGEIEDIKRSLDVWVKDKDLSSYFPEKSQKEISEAAFQKSNQLPPSNKTKTLSEKNSQNSQTSQTNSHSKVKPPINTKESYDNLKIPSKKIVRSSYDKENVSKDGQNKKLSTVKI